MAEALERVVAALPGGGEARRGQVEMAEAVEAVFADGGQLVVQAGTGVGKSLSYLVPAVLSGRTTVIATATKALQDQLANKDLPFLQKHLGKPFMTIVRSVDSLTQLLATDPYRAFRVKDAKRIVTFLREPPQAKVVLPIERDGARVLAMKGCDVFTAYLPTPKGPVFMTLIAKTFGKDVTTRTWDTVTKCAAT